MACSVQVIITNIEGSIQICIQGVSTMNAFEPGLILPIGLRRMTTTRTLLRRVPGVHIYNATAFGFRFVCEKLFQLVKRPIMELTPLFLSLSASLTNVFELLNYNRTPNRKTLHYLLRYAMVHVFTKTVLLLRYAPKVSFRGTCPTGLKFRPQSLVPVTDMFDSSSTKELFIRSHGDTSNTSVDSDKGIRLIFSVWNKFFKHECKKYLSLTIGQIGRFPFPCPELVEVWVGLKFNALDSALCGQDRNFVFIKPDRMRLGIETYGA